MAKIAIAAAVLTALIFTPAVAADMAIKAPPPASAQAALANWAGFYIGGNVGGGIAAANVFDPDCFFCNDNSLRGGFVELGGQAGYNWQFGHAVIGVEGDLNWQSFERTTGVVEGNEITNTKLDSFASVRLRAGLAYDRTLAYVTFGPAWGHANSVSNQFTDTSLTVISNQATDHRWHDGIAAGAGIEYMLAPNWAVRGEYLYLDFTDSLDFLSHSDGRGRKNYANSEQVARVGLDYLFSGGSLPAASSAAPILGKARAAAFPTAAAGWSGWYVGGNVGGGMAEVQFLDPDCFTCGDATNHRGFAALGGQIGYNAQWNSLVLGVVGDIDWTSLDQSGFLDLDQTRSDRVKTRFQMNALASIRGRAGLAVDRTLFYVTAGPAWGHFNSSTTFFPNLSFTTPVHVASEDTWRSGLAAGAGVEVIVDPHWSLFGEYLYYDFSSTTTLLQPPQTTNPFIAKMVYGYSAQVARVGANYSFDARGPAASAPALFKAPAMTANWRGFYLGANAGGGIVDGKAMDMDCHTCGDMDLRIVAATLGGQAGYNWQWGATVIGLEADVDWTSANTTRPFALSDSAPFGPATVQFKMDAFASLRARAGLAVDRSLLYVTAGPAIGHFKENVVATDGSFANPWSGWTPGLAAGAGFAYKLDPHWSLRAEYLHLNFADKIARCVPAATSTDPAGCLISRTQYANSADIARVGIDYSFDWSATGETPPLTSKN
jgi:opacity protein-like surface antigen